MVLGLITATKVALAEDQETFQYTFTIAKGADSKPVCAMIFSDPPANARAIDVKVIEVEVPGIKFALGVDGAAVRLESKATYKTAHIPLTKALQVLQVVADPSFDIGSCGDPRSLPGAAAAPNGDANPSFSDIAAAEALSKIDLKAVIKSPPGKHWYSYGNLDLTYLVHLPSGQPAFPSPARLTEGEAVQVVMMVPRAGKQQTITLQVDGCGAVNTFRVQVAATAVNELQAAKPGAASPADFAYLPVGQYFSCGAGAVTYMLKAQTIANGTTTETTISTTKIAFRPKHHIAAIALLGWDTAQRTTYGADLRFGDTNPVIARRREKIGVTTYVGATWMIGGVDYEDMKLWNYVANVFIAADPSNPTKDVVAGISITPTGGAALSIGVSYHQGQVLEGLVPGNPIAPGTTFPSHGSWNEKGRGLFVGLSVDSRIYDAIVARFAK